MLPKFWQPPFIFNLLNIFGEITVLNHIKLAVLISLGSVWTTCLQPPLIGVSFGLQYIFLVGSPHFIIVWTTIWKHWQHIYRIGTTISKHLDHHWQPPIFVLLVLPMWSKNRIVILYHQRDLVPLSLHKCSIHWILLIEVCRILHFSPVV